MIKVNGFSGMISLLIAAIALYVAYKFGQRSVGA